MFMTLHYTAWCLFSLSACSSIVYQRQFTDPVRGSTTPSGILNIANATALDAVSGKVVCTAARGQNLNVDSCNNALGKIPQDSTFRRFGERGTGILDVQLPARYLSNDGVCAIDIDVDVEITDFDLSNYTQIFQAATSLINNCVRSRVANTGGVYGGLGVEQHLIVSIAKQTPTVTCIPTLPTSVPSYDSCRQAIDTMPCTSDLKYFGRSGVPGVQVPVPKVLASTDGECKFAVFTIQGRTDLSEWVWVWEAAVAVNEMCIKQSSTGFAVVPHTRRGLMRVSFGKRELPGLKGPYDLNMTASDANGLSAS